MEARSMIAAFHEKQQQALRRHVLLAWFSYSRLAASERKAQVQSQLFFSYHMPLLLLRLVLVQYILSDLIAGQLSKVIQS